MSVLDLNCFAYQRRKQPLTLIDREERRNPSALTPIKATSSLANACTIPETPPECLKPSVPRKRPQRKRPNRLFSTSDEEGEGQEVGGEGEERSGGLFRDVVVCKRRKRDPSAEVEGKPRATEVVSWKVKGTDTCVVLSDSSDEDGVLSKCSKWRSKGKPSNCSSSPRNSQRQRLKAFNYASPGGVGRSKFTSPVAHKLRSLPFFSSGNTLRNSPTSSNRSPVRSTSFGSPVSKSPISAKGTSVRNTSLPYYGSPVRDTSFGSPVSKSPISANEPSLRSIAFPSNRIVTHSNRHRRNGRGDRKDFGGGETANLKQLQELFPQHTKDFLEGVLKRFGGNITAAISELLASNGKGRRMEKSRKGCRRLQLGSQDSDDGEGLPESQPLKTRGAVIDSSSEDEEEDVSVTERDCSPLTSGSLAESLKLKLQQFAFCSSHNKEGDAFVDKPDNSQKCEISKQQLPPEEQDPQVVKPDQPVDLEKLEREYQDSSGGDDSDEEDGYSPRQQRVILDLLNASSVDEVGSIPGCSAAKARVILAHRPFDSWKSLVEVLSSSRGTSTRALEGCLQVVREREVLGRLLSKCQGISTAIQSLLSEQQDTEDSSHKVCVKQPVLLTQSYQLKPYQLVGVSWLALLHSQNLNGILADEMGLGKTIQAIAFLAHLFEKGSTGPFLIVVPGSTLSSQKERADIRYEVLSEEECDYEVILTTYNACIGQAEDRRFLRKLSVECLILDEGHMIKNMSSQRYRHLMKIKAGRRILLTGTPLQNNLLELVSLLSFIMPDMFQEFSDLLRSTFSRGRRMDDSSTFYQEQVGQAQQIMQPFVLRRLKSEVLLQLPSKHEHVEYCSLTESQQALYDKTVQRARGELRGRKEMGSEDGSYKQTMSFLAMELRKLANHPLLVRHHYHEDRLKAMATDILKRDADPDLVFEDMTVMSDFELHQLCLTHQCLSQYCLDPVVVKESGKFVWLAEKLKELKASGSRVLLFSQFTMVMDIMESFLSLEGHSYLRLDGSTKVNERQTLIDRYNQHPDILVFLLSTKAGGLGINLTSANVVIIHDIDFNPYNDRQAEDRCHRVGQQRDVHVIRLIGQGTIEEDMLQCAQMKLRLGNDITLAGSSSGDTNSSDITSLLHQGLLMASTG